MPHEIHSRRSRDFFAVDPEGHLRRALARFPMADVAERVLARHSVAGGQDPSAPFPAVAMPALQPRRALLELTVPANFVEVCLAKEDHGGPVGINLLEKVQVATLPSLFGAMLAGVDQVLKTPPGPNPRRIQFPISNRLFQIGRS